MNAPLNAPAVQLAAVSEFLIHESRLLDERRFEEWMALFTPEGYYWAPARIEQSDPWEEVSLIFDGHEIMKDRIQRLRHPKIYAQLPHSRAVRQVSNIAIDDINNTNGELSTRAVLFMFEHRPTLPTPIERTFAGHSYHRLRREGDSFKIVWKKVVLANCDAGFDPLFLYF